MPVLLSEAHRGGVVTVSLFCVCALCARPSCVLGLLGTKVATGSFVPRVLTLAVSPTPAWYLQGDPYPHFYSSLMFRK